ncbi:MULTISPECIES: phage terminase small subunit P27 family [Paraburkholderia]|uniref:Phage terminase small subunit P27 family n=1 Tax=Paraburkholderia madseniana TaxID=2599607 RepID=A0AAP5BBP7_9BURK|nr:MULTISPECIES: phage terminase small subunit P27 family [Paraburkholderia]MCX4146760.1 phage terminase small subunit P27 family [Paraburkholderia madseniana]MDN7149706.1 phage terminase small subunit P27 family [Paraburkholderia sp. WS6]MDQ6408586.1 phage terminase small subunit P27 family [Paraburkholderia madseniana]
MRGRKPIPTALKLVRGNPGKRPLPKTEPRPELAVLVPDWLSPAARKHWPTIADPLRAAGLLTALDTTALGLYCEAFARWQYANEQIVKLGPVVEGAAGYSVKSPFVTIANTAYEQLTRMLVEFGMTPSSRSRVTATKPDDTSPYAQFVKKT